MTTIGISFFFLIKLYKMAADIEGTHPYQQLYEEDEVYKYEKFLRLQRRTCSGQRFTAICILASTITLIVILLCFLGGNDDLWAGTIPNSHSYFDISVSTTCGTVEGEATNDGFVFKGIPYALPPTGRKRWQKSQPLLSHKGCWRGKLETKRFASKCVQQNPLSGKIEGDENCLFLNVFTPTLDNLSLLPVVVYVHGGDFMWGSGHQLGLSPEMSVSHEYNIIIVTFNYRLSVFGFLVIDLPSSNTSDSQLTGNYGLHDQILALKWVQQNIRNFGGDPDKVTLFGQGSGGSCALALLASTAANNLFQRMWLSSPKLINYMSLQGDILPASTQDFWKSDFINDVPLLIGSTAQVEEIELGTDSTSWTIHQFEDYAQQMANFIRANDSQLLAQLYYNESNPQLSLLSAISDKQSVCPTNLLANQTSVLLSPVYRYVTTGQLSKVIQLPFTQHLARYSFPTIDLITFFGLLKHYIQEPSDNDYMFKEQIQSMAIDFVQCGSMQMSSWKPYPKTIALISNKINLVPDYHKDQCHFWILAAQRV
uniref:Carboxylesterase type B domain-containing protein n=1 Tax=Strigamia maritima TaxID=126957 RepID=T1J3T4_STRMM